MKLILILFLSLSTMDQEVTSQTNCMSLAGKSIDDVRAELLLAARRGAVEQLFGGLVTSLSQVEDFVLKKDQIRTVSMGYVRIIGNPVFFNGDSLGDVCIKIQVYATEEDRAKLKPKELSKKACVAEGDVGTIRRRAEEKAVLEALTDYDAGLKGMSSARVLPLLHEVRFSEGEFAKDAPAYCVRATGILYPIEVVAITIQDRGERNPHSGPSVPSRLEFLPTPASPSVPLSIDVSGSWEFSITAKRVIDDTGAVVSLRESANVWINLKQYNHNIEGEIVASPTDGSCQEGTIKGTIRDKSVRWSVIYTGSCCRNGEESFSGEVGRSAGGLLIRGKIEPKETPPPGCRLWWADAVGFRRQ